eukprot:g26326.t1
MSRLQDPRPPAPELPDHFTEEHLEAIPTEAHLPDTILGGMALHFEMDVRESCAVLPLKPQLPSKMSDLVPKTDLDYDGLVVLRLQGWGCGQDKADGQPSTVVVPDVRCSLCVGVTEVSVYKSAEARPDLSSFGRCGAPIKALQGIMSSRGAERGAERGEVQSCLTASLSIGPQGQALLELLPPLELQSHGWTCGTFQVPLHMLQKVNTESHGFGQHFWQVLAEAIPPKKNHCSLAFAFPLGAQEKDLLVVLQREKIRDEHCDVEPGGTADFGRSPFGGKLLLAVEGEEPQVLDLPAEALSDRSKFKDGVDRLNGHIGDRLSSNMSCSLHCSWQAGQSPEMVITGKCLLFNKTGLTLQVAERVERDSAQQPAAQLCPGGAAVLGTEAEVCIGLGLQQVVSRSSRDHPEKQLKRQREASEVDGLEQQAILWPLSRYCRCMAAEPQNTGGVKGVMPRDRAAWRGGGAGPLPSAISRAGVDADADVDLQPELAPKVHAGRLPACEDVLALSATELGEEVKAISGPASTSAGSSPSSFSARPERYRRAAQLLHGAFEVEKAAEHEFAGPDPPGDDNAATPLVHAVLGIPRFPGKGVTVTPRFILRNASESFVQVMPGLLPNKKSGDEPAVTNRVEEIIKEFSGDQRDE